MFAIDLITLVYDIKKSCIQHHGLCDRCPYKYVSGLFCNLKGVEYDELKKVAKVYESKGFSNPINRNFESDLHVIKKTLDELCVSVDIYINGGGINE